MGHLNRIFNFQLAMHRMRDPRTKRLSFGLWQLTESPRVTGKWSRKSEFVPSPQWSAMHRSRVQAGRESAPVSGISRRRSFTWALRPSRYPSTRKACGGGGRAPASSRSSHTGTCCESTIDSCKAGVYQHNCKLVGPSPRSCRRTRFSIPMPRSQMFSRPTHQMRGWLHPG